MKRDMELIRAILLKVETEGTSPIGWIEDFGIDGYEDEMVSYHVWMLHQAGLIEALDGSTMEGFSYDPRCLTWSGAEFLESIRDAEVWRKTKEGAAKAGGAGVELLWDLAKAYGKLKIREVTGIEF